jgi:hypothetical protein
MTDAQIQALINAAKTNPADLVTWAELKAILEGLLSQVNLTDLGNATAGQIPKYNGSAWALSSDIGLNASQSVTANRTYSIDTNTLTWDGGDVSGAPTMFVFNNDLASGGSQTWSEFKPLKKSVNGKSWFVHQFSNNGGGPIWNEVMIQGWNMSSGGGLANPALGFAIGDSYESNYDPDGDGVNPWGEIHKMYVTPSGTQVRLESYTINPAAKDVNYYMHVNFFALNDATQAIDGNPQQSLFAIEKQVSGATMSLSNPNYILKFQKNDSNTMFIYPASIGVGVSPRLNFYDWDYILIPKLKDSPSYADDAAAAAGGVPVSGLYRTDSSVKIRLA